MRNYPKIPSQLPPTDICSEVAPVVLYNINQSEKVAISNHDELNNLDKPNQHPIEAIIGLQEELSRLDNKEVIVEEVDPTVPNWAKQENKPEYTFDEVGALSKDTKLSDLPQDENHRTVTDEQIRKWSEEIIIPEGFSGDYNDLTNKPVIPTKLAQLEQDDEHLTVTLLEKQQWNSGTGNSGGSNFSGDYNDLINKPTLAQLEQDDEHQTVTATDKENWNSKLSSQQNVEDAGKIFTIDIDGKTIYKPLSELVSGLTWGMLAGKS